MRKFLVRTIPIVILTLFILIMNSDNFLKKPLGKNDNVPKFIQLTIQDIKDEKWDDANKKTDQLSEAWKKIVTRIQFSAEKDEINSFDLNIARLRGAILTKNKSSAVMELNEAYEHWENVGK